MKKSNNTREERRNNKYLRIILIFLLFAILMGLLYYIGKKKYPKKFAQIPIETLDEMSRLSDDSNYTLNIPKGAIDWDNDKDAGMDLDLSDLLGGNLDDLKKTIPGFFDPDRLDLDPLIKELGDLAKALGDPSYGSNPDGQPFGDPYDREGQPPSEGDDANPFGKDIDNPFQPARDPNAELFGRGPGSGNQGYGNPNVGGQGAGDQGNGYGHSGGNSGYGNQDNGNDPNGGGNGSGDQGRGNGPNSGGQGSGFGPGAGNQGAGSQGSGNRGAGDQGTNGQGAGSKGAGNGSGAGSQEAGGQGVGDQGTGGQGSGNRGVGGQGANGQGAGNQGAGNGSGTGNQRAGGQGVGNQETGGQGTGNQGAGGQGSGNRDTGGQGSDYQGAGNQGYDDGLGAGNQGGNSGSGYPSEGGSAYATISDESTAPKTSAKEKWNDFMEGKVEIPGRSQRVVLDSKYEQTIMTRSVEKGQAEEISPGIYYVRRPGKMSYLESANFIVYFVTDDLDIWKECALQTILEAEAAIPGVRQVMGRYYYPKDMNGRKLPIYLPCNGRAYKNLCSTLSVGQEAKMSELSTNIYEINESGCATKAVIINPKCYADKTRPHNNYKVAVRHGMALYVYFSSLDYTNLQRQHLWVTEGLADFVARRGPGKITAPNRVQYIVDNCNISREFPKEKHAYCWAGESFYKFVASTCGTEAVKTLIQKLYQMPMEMALLYVFPDVQSAQRAWIAYLSGQETVATSSI